MAKKEKWIQGAHLDEGAFTAKAKKAGMSVQAFAAYVLESKDRYDEKTVKQANLAKTFKKMAKAEEGVVVTGKVSLDEAYSAQPQFSE